MAPSPLCKSSMNECFHIVFLYDTGLFGYVRRKRVAIQQVYRHRQQTLVFHVHFLRGYHLRITLNMKLLYSVSIHGSRVYQRISNIESNKRCLVKIMIKTKIRCSVIFFSVFPKCLRSLETSHIIYKSCRN